MRKKIAVFLGDAHNEYPKAISKSASRKAAELGYDLFAFAIYGSNGDNLLYADGEKHVLHLADFKAFDGLILCKDTFDIEGVEDAIDNMVTENATCPTVYLRRKNENHHNVMISGKGAMEELVRHVIREHGARDICFMNGPAQLADSKERFGAFLTVCEEEGIPVTDRMVFEGDFWRMKGKAALDHFMEGRDTYPQAIICANDYMAISVCDELKKRKVRIPEDVIVTGYDNTLEAQRYMPSITSVGVDFSELAVKAVEMIDRINRGEEVPKTETVSSKVCLSRSCGCGEQIYVDDWAEVLGKINVHSEKTRHIVFMTTDFQGVYDEKDYLRNAAKYFPDTNAAVGYLCLCCEEEQSEDTDQEREMYSEKMALKRIYRADGSYEVLNEVFDRNEILPARIFETEKPGFYLIQGIHHKNKSYGYFVLVYDEDKWIDEYTQPYVTCLANVIDDTEVHKQMLDLEEYQRLSQIDPLTGIYNRRGFERQLHRLYDKVRETGEHLAIASIDMDKLKYINDNFGHAEGDFALSCLARVLTKITDKREICARVGGDEYNVVLISGDAERAKDFPEIFFKALEDEEAKVGKPYPIKASIGVCSVNEKVEVSLMGCLQEADERMYINKRARRGGADIR